MIDDSEAHVRMTATYYSKSDFIVTSTGNIVSKNSVLHGTNNIHMAGRSIIEKTAILRGDFAVIKLGRHVYVGEGVTLIPPVKKVKGQVVHLPLNIGDNVMIERGCEIGAASIGTNVKIGAGSQIGKRCIIKDNSVILPESVLAPDTVVPPLSVYGGAPAVFVGELPESSSLMQRVCASVNVYYYSYTCD
eukprot:GHVO01043270.1.p1 GENE.GHVO01043270.1~~GHVO01043270.1.p1  ORF type:complete len:198 (+),score=22.97 GHVO01043270.1:26-595(+)